MFGPIAPSTLPKALYVPYFDKEDGALTGCVHKPGEYDHIDVINICSQLHELSIELDFNALWEGPFDSLADPPNYPSLSSVDRIVRRYGLDVVLRMPTLRVLRIIRADYKKSKELYWQCEVYGKGALRQRWNELMIWIDRNKLESLQLTVS